MAQIKGKRRPPKVTTKQLQLQQQRKKNYNNEEANCINDPECQCYLRRGLFLPPGLEELVNAKEASDTADGRN